MGQQSGGAGKKEEQGRSVGRTLSHLPLSPTYYFLLPSYPLPCSPRRHRVCPAGPPSFLKAAAAHVMYVHVWGNNYVGTHMRKYQSRTLYYAMDERGGEKGGGEFICLKHTHTWKNKKKSVRPNDGRKIWRKSLSSCAVILELRLDPAAAVPLLASISKKPPLPFAHPSPLFSLPCTWHFSHALPASISHTSTNTRMERGGFFCTPLNGWGKGKSIDISKPERERKQSSKPRI